MNKIVLATTNQGKIKDFQELIRELPIEMIPQTQLNVPEIEEIGHSFVENAILKARNAAHHTGLPAIGDDSGLITDALKGAPGLYSARYAKKGATDAENIQKLLDELKKIPNAERTARFYTVCVYLRYPNDPAPIICEGTLEGEILEAPRGNQGFGYLPIFYLPKLGCAAAELSLAARNKIGHRALAFQKLLHHLLSHNV